MRGGGGTFFGAAAASAAAPDAEAVLAGRADAPPRRRTSRRERRHKRATAEEDMGEGGREACPGEGRYSVGWWSPSRAAVAARCWGRSAWGASRRWRA